MDKVPIPMNGGDLRMVNRMDRWTHIFADGSNYVGSFVDGSGTGKGSYTYGPNAEWAGDKYVGDHDTWVRSGIGTYLCANGAVLEGIWKDGEYQYHREIVNAVELSLSGQMF